MVGARALLLLMVPGCRIWFDPIDLGSDASSAGDASPDSTLACGGGTARVVTFGERTESMIKNVTSDTMLIAANPTENFGTQPAMSLRGGGVERGILRFDLSSITGCPEQVTLARLQLYLPNSGDQTAGTLAVNIVTESWVEGTNFSGPGPGATWDVRDTGLPWSTPGGGALTPAVASITAGDVAAPVQLELPPNIVAGWIASPSSNYGVLLSSPDAHWHPIAKDGPEPPQRPQLVLDLAP